jgi:multidrug resistance efflux pump
MQITTGLFMLTMALTGPVAQRDIQDSTAPGVKVSHCVVTLIGDMRVPARHAGVLSELLPHEGEVVTKDLLIAHIDDRDAEQRMYVAQYEYESAQQQAENDVRIRAAEASKEVAFANWDKSKAINDKSPGSISATELRRLKLEYDHAELQIELAHMEYDVAASTSEAHKAQYGLATKEYNDCAVHAPWDGVVVERYRREGEWLQQGEPILRMVQMDQVRVEGFLKIEDFSPLEVDGADVIVEFELTRGRIERRRSKIAFVSPQVEAGEFRVWAYVDNTLETNARGKQQWLLRPGMIADMTIVLDGAEPKVAQR